MQRMIHDWIDLGRAEDGTLHRHAGPPFPSTRCLSALERDCRRALELRRQRLVVGERAPLVRADGRSSAGPCRTSWTTPSIHASRRHHHDRLPGAPGSTRLRVRDEGPGVPEADRGHLRSSRAVQGPRTARRAAISILLPGSASSPRAQGGRIWVEPERATRQRVHSRAEGHRMNDTEKRRVLVVDDDDGPPRTSASSFAPASRSNRARRKDDRAHRRDRRGLRS